MAEQNHEESLLRRAAASVAWPPTPDLRLRVGAAVAAVPQGFATRHRAPSRRGARTWPAVVSLAVLAGVIAVLAAMAVPASRDAIADFFGVEGSRIEFLPTPAPDASQTAYPASGDIAWEAQRVALTRAAGALGFPPSLPNGETPDAVFLLDYAGHPVAVLRYRGFDLWVTQLVAGANFGKDVLPGGRYEVVGVHGAPANWLTGAPHFVHFESPDGTFVEASQRFVDRSTLIWNAGGVFYRLETDLPRDQAIAIAESLE